jgi:hypothetical protein
MAGFSFLVGDYLHRHNEIALDNLTALDADRSISVKTRQIVAAIGAATSTGNDEDGKIILASALAMERDFSPNFERFYGLYRDRSDFAGIIDEAIDAYLRRRKVEASSGDKVWQHCVLYQLEELAMFEQLASKGFEALIYPGPQLPVMKAIVNGKLTGISDSLRTLSLVELRIFEE